MSLTELLDGLIALPLLDIYDVVFSAFLGATGGDVARSLVGFSLVLNLALTPVYAQMERAGRSAATKRSAMDAEVARMKRHYRGRERYYYVRAVHRQFGYHPLHAVASSGELFIQILVFATVYRYLAGHPALKTASLWAIADLGRPDGLLGGVNLLPILMTLLNAGSVLMYTSDAAKRRTGLILAALFLGLLYSSPSGLVLYWTVNNMYSFLRNFVEKRLVPRAPASLRASLDALASQR